MVETIDVHDLAAEDVKINQEWVDKLRGKTVAETSDEQNEVDLEPLNTRPLGVKGKFSRKEIYAPL